MFKSKRLLQTHTHTDARTKPSYTTLNANASTISPTLRLWFGSKRSCYKSQARVVTIATSSKIPPSTVEERKGSLTPPSLSLYSGLRFLHCQWSGIPDTDRDTFSDAPRGAPGTPELPLVHKPLPRSPNCPLSPCTAHPFSRGFSFFLRLLMTQA